MAECTCRRFWWCFRWEGGLFPPLDFPFPDLLLVELLLCFLGLQQNSWVWKYVVMVTSLRAEIQNDKREEWPLMQESCFLFLSESPP